MQRLDRAARLSTGTNKCTEDHLMPRQIEIFDLVVEGFTSHARWNQIHWLREQRA
jgi:hypothetical protein